jgi:SAM-dependent methyltransferase
MTVANVEQIVKERYREGARSQVEELCCPIDYDPRYLRVIPEEVLARDYGCGDPSRYVRPGETVLDLGSGTGKICFIAAQVVGAEGRVIGIDMTPEMLEVARRNAPVVAERLGYSNVEFRRGRIQDLQLDLDQLELELQQEPIADVEAWLKVQDRGRSLRTEKPLVSDESVDVVVSNCVLNLVENGQKRQMFEEIYRVLKDGGRAVISDIVGDEPVPVEMQKDADLWSGCISGALTEKGFLEAFEGAGFHGIRILDRAAEPWRTVEGIEFRSLTVEAFKGKDGPCLERLQAVIYKGPFKEVLDDDDHRIVRGERYAVCDKTYRLFQRQPYREVFEFVEPLEKIPRDEAGAFDCSRNSTRHPRETKGKDYRVTTEKDTTCCGPDGCC